jgi:TPR repeat protein
MKTFLKREIMKKTIIVSILALLLFLGLFPAISIGDEQAKKHDDVALEIKTVEVMVDQLEKMLRATEDEANAWARLSWDIENRFSKIITYETRDNLNLWKLVGRWATAEGISGKSPNANAPFFHIQRLRPDYQKNELLILLMAKLNVIRNEEHQNLEINGYQNFVYLFEECDTDDADIQLRIGLAYDEGYGLWENNIEAVKWYKRAATAGNADAIGELGQAYLYRSLGVEKNVETGVKLLNEAVLKGSASAAYYLGQHYAPFKLLNRKGNKEKSIQMFRIAAERGYYEAFHPLAMGYVEIDNGTEALRWANGGDEPNVSDKIKYSWWESKRSMADHDGRCSYVKGEVYALGVGEIEQNLVRAKELFEESYRKGFKGGAVAIAAMYREGVGVEANRVLAEQWKNKAVKLFGFPDSERFIDGEIRAFAKRLREASTR